MHVYRSVLPRSNPADARAVEKSRPVVNGNTKRDSLLIKDTSKGPRPGRPDMQRQDANPSRRDPRPSSPNRSLPESKQPKRPLESGDSSRPEKRTKIEIAASRTPSDSQKASHPKSLPSEAKPSPTKTSKAPVSIQASPLPKKGSSTTRQVDNKTHSSKHPEDKPHIPRLLSPLPGDIVVPAQTNFSSVRRSELEKSASPKIPPQKTKQTTTTASDTIVVKPRQMKIAASTSSPRSTPSSSTLPFVLPRMLSPGLPDVVEAELTRLQHKKSTPSNHTVEARYEKVRQPGAPGVPQKAPRSNIGHPPKKGQAESSQSRKSTIPEKQQLIVKIKYKKRQANNIHRILQLRSGPTNEFKEIEKKRVQTGDQSIAPVRFDTDSEEEDMPISGSHSFKMPAKTPARKRPQPKSDSEEDSDSGGAALSAQANRLFKPSDNNTSRKRPAAAPDRVESVSKRPKSSDASTTKVSTPLAQGAKSPTVTGSSLSRDNLLLSTPTKRGEAAKKSTAMGRVISSDGGQARTPKAPANTSTPASIEKVRVNGHRPEIDQAQVEHASRQHKTYFNLGTLLKRHLQSKLAGDKSGSVSFIQIYIPCIQKCLETILRTLLILPNSHPRLLLMPNVRRQL